MEKPKQVTSPPDWRKIFDKCPGLNPPGYTEIAYRKIHEPQFSGILKNDED